MPRRTPGTIASRGIGRPDYAQAFPLGQQAKPTVYTLTDMAELAARLGSIVTYDRRGDVVFLDDFESGIDGWEQLTAGTGAAVSWSADRYSSGGFSAKLISGSDGLMYAGLKKYLFIPVLSKMGFGLLWSYDDSLDNVLGYINLYTGAYRLRWGFKYSLPDKRNYVWNNLGAWQEVGGEQEGWNGTRLFQPAKVVIDPSNSIYTRFLAAASASDVATIACQTTVDVTKAHILLELYVYSQTGLNAESYFDSVVITQNEPAGAGW